MKVWGMWWGGPNYSVGYVEDDTEEFKSLKQAKEVFEGRYNDFPLKFYPNVTRESEMTIWFYDPRESGDTDPYPDRIIKFGPRGGVKVEPA